MSIPDLALTGTYLNGCRISKVQSPAYPGRVGHVSCLKAQESHCQSVHTTPYSEHHMVGTGVQHRMVSTTFANPGVDNTDLFDIPMVWLSISQFPLWCSKEQECKLTRMLDPCNDSVLGYLFAFVSEEGWGENPTLFAFVAKSITSTLSKAIWELKQ